MTNREFYNAIMKYDELTTDQKNEIIEFAATAIAKLDKTNEARKDATARKAIEREAERAPIREAIMGCITEEPKTATTLIAEACVELKPQAIPSLLKPCVAEGRIEKVKVKVKGKGEQVGYKLV